MRRPLAYAKDVAEKRRSGARVGLLVVSLHDWEAGKWFESSPEVCRVLLPADLPVADVDWSICLALDVVLCGSASNAVFADVALACMASGAASVWGEFSDGFARVEALAGRKVFADGDRVPLNKLGAAVRRFREVALVLGLAGYASRLFRPARDALVAPLLAELEAALCGEGA